jgi:hypothetical protein
MMVSCGKEIKYKEVTKDFLKKEMMTPLQKEECAWLYGKNQKYHFFEYACRAHKDTYDSFLIIKKRYKIKKDRLHVKTAYKQPDTDRAYTAMLKDRIWIEW